jgi:hypothetical protein
VRRGAPFECQQLLQEDPQPSPAARLDVSLKPDPLPDSMKSILIGLTSSKSFLSTRKVIPLSVKTSSFPCDSSRAIPSEGPPHPACMSIRMEGASVRLFRYSFIISLAFSVTSNIFSSLCVSAGGASPVNCAVNYACPCVLSICIYSTNSPRFPRIEALSNMVLSRSMAVSGASLQASFRSPEAIACKPVRSRIAI